MFRTTQSSRSTLVRWCASLVACICGAIVSGRALETPGYHTHAQLTSELQALVKAHPQLAKLIEIGKSGQGRSLWAVEIGGPGSASVATRPAVLVVANLEGDGLSGSELALRVIEGLVTGYATSPDVKRQLDSSVFYVVPRLNPDAAEEYFAAVRTGRRTTATPFDADNDGRVDEDGPEDLNKDSLITMMRVKDPAGPYTTLADDPRLMKRADPQKGESGGWAVYWEGLDNDGDGFYNEDGTGGADLDRNFPHQYPYYTPDAGRHMVSEPETRALLDFALAHRNIGCILTFGASDNLVSVAGGRAATIDIVSFASEATTAARGSGLVRDTPPTAFFGGGPIDGTEFAPPARPPAPQRPPAPRPATTIHASDLDFFRSVGEKYKELTGIRHIASARKPAGALFEWSYFQFGVPGFSTPGWGAKAKAGSTEPGRRTDTAGTSAASPAAPPAAGADGAAAGSGAEDLALLEWLDVEKTDAFVSWTPFTHPTLGAVEIGGFRPYATTAPAAGLAELARTHTSFALHLSTLLPRVAIAEAAVSSHGGGLFRIKAEIENRGTWPTALQHAVTARAVKPVLVQLGVDPSAIVSGHPKTNLLPTLAGGGRREKYEWIVRGKPGQQVTLKVVAEKGGTVTRTLTLE